MSVLICKNVKTEGPGTIEDFLVLQGIPYKIVELSKGKDMPEPDDFDTLIMMGGPMSVNEEGIYPYLREEGNIAKEFMSDGKKVLGICLGAQIMAKALGSKVYVGTEKEIGWYDLEITEDGLNDSCMRHLALHPYRRKFKIFQWHGETFDLPAGAVRLATSRLYPNQAFRFGKNAYAFQFHMEMSEEMIWEWLREETDHRKIRRQTDMFFEEYRERASQFYKSFFSVLG